MPDALFIRPLPVNPEEHVNFLYEELERVAILITALANGGLLNEYNAEPDKPRNGMLVIADGTNWNPGAGGRGVYWYDESGSSWNKL